MAERPDPATADGAQRAWNLDPDVIAERTGGEIVVVHLQTNKIYELNSTAARIFELMRAGVDRAGLESALSREYAVDPAQLAASLDRVVEELRAAQILR